MTPNKEPTIYNDAPEDLRYKLKCAIMELTDEECAEILLSMTNHIKGVQLC